MYPITNNVANQQIQSSSSLGDNQQAIIAVEQIEETIAQLETLLNQNPPNQAAITNCRNQLVSQWNTFSSIPINDPYGMVRPFINLTGQSVFAVMTDIDHDDFSGASQECRDALIWCNSLVSALQNGAK